MDTKYISSLYFMNQYMYIDVLALKSKPPRRTGPLNMKSGITNVVKQKTMHKNFGIWSRVVIR